MDTLITIASIIAPMTAVPSTVYIPYKYYSGDSLTKFMANDREKLLAKITKYIGILLYDIIIAVFLFSFIFKTVGGIDIESIEVSNNSERTTLILILIMVYFLTYILSLSVINLFNKFVMYNYHTFPKKSNFYILLNKDYNSELLTDDKLFLSIIGKKDILCYKEVVINEKRKYLKAYLPTDFIKEHTIFTVENLSPIEKRNKSRKELEGSINASKFALIPMWLLAIIFISYSVYAFINFLSSNGAERNISLVFNIPFICWMLFFSWWITGKSVLNLIWKRTFTIKKNMISENEKDA